LTLFVSDAHNALTKGTSIAAESFCFFGAADDGGGDEMLLPTQVQSSYKVTAHPIRAIWATWQGHNPIVTASFSSKSKLTTQLHRRICETWYSQLCKVHLLLS
jgi:hypothetical protein